MKKLTTKEIITLMEDGAVLRKTYCRYSYWTLTTKDGLKIWWLREGSPESAKSKIKYDIIEQDKTGYTIKLKSN